MAKQCFERKKSNEGMKCKSFEVKVLPGSLIYPKLGCHMLFMQNFIIFKMLKLALWRAFGMKGKKEKKNLNVPLFAHK